MDRKIAVQIFASTGAAKRRWINPRSVRVVLTSVFLAIHSPESWAQTISRGHQILLQRGLQLNAFAHGSLNLNVLDQSNFTTVFLDNLHVDTLQSLGPAPGLPWGRLFYTGSPNFPRLTSAEVPYQSNLVSMQLNDELDVSNQVVLDEAKFVLDYWRYAHPNSIGYLNQYGPQNTNAQLSNYLAYVQPDMLMFDYYPFNGSLADGSPTLYYSFLQKYRQLGLGGVDGSGQQPIPTGLYLQSFTDPAHLHLPSPSETRFNQFSAWTFGYKFATAITYSGSTTTGTLSTLFVGDGDGTVREPQFSAMAETNRQSQNLGPALVRLLSTDVRISLGQHKAGSLTVSNSQPDGVPLWVAGAGDDPYLTAVGATNIGGSNSGLRGDVVIGHFKPLQAPNDLYMMVLNGLSIPTGTVADAAQRIRLAFNFGASGINSLLRLNRNTGLVEVVSLIHDVGALYHLDVNLDGGTGDLFKYNNGLPFVTPIPGDFDLDGDVDGADFVVWQTNFPKSSGATLAMGDGDSDGDVDGADFVIWQTHFPLATAAAFIPEPPTMVSALLASVLTCLSNTRTRRRFEPI